MDIFFILFVLIYYGSFCTGLTASVYNDSSMDSIHPMTPHWVFANSSFNITAYMKEINPLEVSNCKLDKSSTDKIVLIFQATNPCGQKPFFDSCKGVRCAGLIFSFEMDASFSELIAHETWYIESTIPGRTFSNVPAVVLKSNFEWFKKFSNKNIIVTMISGENNGILPVLRSWFWILINIMGLLHSLINLAMSAYKLILSVHIIQTTALSHAILWILVSQSLGNAIRALKLLNFACFEFQLLPYSLTRLSYSLPVSFSIISTLALSTLVYKPYMELKNAKPSRIYKILMVLLMFVILMDITNAIYASVVVDLISVVPINIVYVILQIILAVVFIKFGNGTAAKMMKMSKSVVGSGSYQKRAQFAWRMKWIGIAMLINCLCFIIFVFATGVVTTGVISKDVWMLTFFLISESLNPISTLTIIAVRLPTGNYSLQSSKSGGTSKPRGSNTSPSKPLVSNSGISKPQVTSS
jgi:hypothetical protein